MPTTPSINTEDNTALEQLLKEHEGLSLTPYEDPPGSGQAAVGYGRNVTTNPLNDQEIQVLMDNAFHRGVTMQPGVLPPEGITKQDAELLFRNDLHTSRLAARRVVPNYRNLNQPRRDAVTNMAYNLGATGLAGFSNMIQALTEERWTDAEHEFLDSDLVKKKQIPQTRIHDLQYMIRTGKYPKKGNTK